MGVYVGCCGSYVNPHEDMGGECVSCRNKRIKNERKMEGKEMGNAERLVVSNEEYLKVVEEKEKFEKDWYEQIEIKKHFINKSDRLEKELEEKNEKIKTFEKNSSDLFKLTKFISEERNCYGRAGELSVDVAIETIKNLEKELEELELSDKSKEESNIKLYNVIKEKDIEIVRKMESIKCLADFSKKLKEEYDRLKDIYKNDFTYQKEEIQNLYKKLEKKDKELYGLDIRCESLEEENEGLRNDLSYKDNFYKGLKEENEKMKEHIEVLTNLLKENEEPMEDTYTLIYGWVDDKGNKREYKQEGLLMEDFTEMFGMDSDNWEYHVLVKETE